MIPYYLAKLLLECTQFAVMDFFRDLILTNRRECRCLVRLKARLDFHSSVNIQLLFIFYSYY